MISICRWHPVWRGLPILSCQKDRASHCSPQGSLCYQTPPFPYLAQPADCFLCRGSPARNVGRQGKIWFRYSQKYWAKVISNPWVLVTMLDCCRVEFFQFSAEMLTSGNTVGMCTSPHSHTGDTDTGFQRSNHPMWWMQAWLHKPDLPCFHLRFWCSSSPFWIMYSELLLSGPIIWLRRYLEVS